MLAVVLAAYAWWATGVAPFTAAAYLLVALVALVVLVGYARRGGLTPGRADVDDHYRRRVDRRARDAVPWIAWLTAVVALEAVGLALGGRSRTVPTLSTTVDHLLVTHGVRAALFLLWTLVGVGAVRGLALRRGS